MMKSASEMENSIFQKVRSQDDYQNMITKLVMHMQGDRYKCRCYSAFHYIQYFALTFLGQKNKKQQSEAMDPINALQNLTNQGSRNPMPNQMMPMGNQPMGMGNANPNANVLQNLINVSL